MSMVRYGMGEHEKSMCNGVFSKHADGVFRVLQKVFMDLYLVISASFS